MLNSLQFWTLVAGLVAFVAKFFYPNFPVDETQILAALLFLLGLIGVVPQLRTRAVTGYNLLTSKAFWTLVAGLVSFVVHYYFPTFPLDQAVLLSVIFFVLSAFGVNPELRKNNLM